MIHRSEIQSKIVKLKYEILIYCQMQMIYYRRLPTYDAA